MFRLGHLRSWLKLDEVRGLLPGLARKAAIEDKHTALATSANLTGHVIDVR